ncbi:MAG: hypothetical protein AAGM84_13390 [Pseudomonadota bacterium]
MPRLWMLSAVLGTAAAAIIGALYLAAQDAPQDIGLVILLTLNSAIVGLAGPVLNRLARSFFESHDVADSGAVHAMLGAPVHLIGGALYACIIPAGVWLMDVLPHAEASLNLWLMAFLYAANVHIGFALSGMAAFWQRSKRAIDRLDLRVLHLSRQDLVALLDLISATVIVTGVVASLAIVSILFSYFDLGAAVILFSLFAFVVVASSYLVPLSPLVLKLRRLKLEALGDVEARIDAAFDAQLTTGTAPDGLDGLIQVRDELRAVQTFPPNGQFSVSTALLATFLSFLPTLLDYLL